MKNKITTDLLISELIYKYLRHEISRDEQEILDSWTKNADHTAFFESLQESGRLYDGLLQTHDQDINLQFERLQRKITRKKYRNWGIGIAAILMIGIGISILLFPGRASVIPPLAIQLPAEDQSFLRRPGGETVYFSDTVREITHPKQNLPVQTKDSIIPEILRYNLLVTSSHGKIEIMLSDSTQVWLNGGSELQYPEVFGQGERRVYLKGEAYFEVKKDRSCPFIVDTKMAKIAVLGTQFNVNAYRSEHCVTTLVEGLVKIENKKQETAILCPGQQAIVDEEEGIGIQEVDSRYYVAWKNNQFAFQDATLFQILNELADWYDFTFEFENLQQCNYTYTAIIPRYADVDGVLRLLERTDDFRYTRDQEGHITIRER